MDSKDTTTNMRSYATQPYSSRLQQRRPNSNSIFQVSNPSAEDDRYSDHDRVGYDQDLEYASPPPSSLGHCQHCHQARVPNAHANTRSAEPPLVIDEKRWRRRFLRSRSCDPGRVAKTKVVDKRESDSDISTNTRTSTTLTTSTTTSPPRYTPDGFVYRYPHCGHEEEEEEMEEEGYDEYAYQREDEEDVQRLVSHRERHRNGTVLLNPHAYGQQSYSVSYPNGVSSDGHRTNTTRNRDINAPQPRMYAHLPQPSTFHHSEESHMHTHSPPVRFADVRPLTIRRRVRRKGVQLFDPPRQPQQQEYFQHREVRQQYKSQDRSQLPPPPSMTSGMNGIGTDKIRRHSEGQGLNLVHYPHSYISHGTTPMPAQAHTTPMRSVYTMGSPFHSQEPWAEHTPEFMGAGMGKSSSYDYHDRNRNFVGESYTTSTRTGMGTGVSRPELGHVRREGSSFPFSSTTPNANLTPGNNPRRPPIRLSYVDERSDPPPRSFESYAGEREFQRHFPTLPLPMPLQTPVPSFHRPTASSAAATAPATAMMDDLEDLGLGTPRAAPRPPPLSLLSTSMLMHPGSKAGRGSQQQQQQQQQHRGDVKPHSSSSRTTKAGSKSTTRTVSSQPKAHPAMSVSHGGKGRRNPKGMPYGDDGKRDWSTDLCAFCDHNLGTCCKALFCPCIIYGRNKARLERLNAEDEDSISLSDNDYEQKGKGGSKRQRQLPAEKPGTFTSGCVLHAVLTTFTLCLGGWAVQIPTRSRIRRRYDIEGDTLGDCAATVCCSPCELAQESREIDLEEGWRGARHGGSLIPGSD